MYIVWSGDSEYFIECLSEGVGVLSGLFGGGENFLFGEFVFVFGESYCSFDVVFVWSDVGIDGLSVWFYVLVWVSVVYLCCLCFLVFNIWEVVYM